MLGRVAGRNVYLDSNIVIFAIETGNQYSTILVSLFRAIGEGTVRTFTSELTLAEVLTKPIALRAADVIAAYNEALAPDSAVRTIPISRAILLAAADFRARTRAKLMDAIHVATAQSCDCDVFLTNDKELGRKLDAKLGWLQLSDLAEDR